MYRVEACNAAGDPDWERGEIISQNAALDLANHKIKEPRCRVQVYRQDGDREVVVMRYDFDGFDL